jgi:hypothetical protein
MQAISQGELELVRFDTNGLLREIQRTLFPKITSQVTCHYGHIPTLSFVERVGENRYAISLHSMFNHPETPELVIRHMLIHELLHLEVPARALREGEVDPRISRKKGQEPQESLGPIAHPAEFWVRERELSPDRIVAMRWIFEAFWGRLEYRAREEQFRVRKWRSEFGRRVVRPTIEEVRAGLLEQASEYPDGLGVGV